MGASPLFPLFVAFFLLGVAALGRDYQAMSQTTTRAAAYTRLQAGAFLRYRDTVTAYVVSNPGFTGNVPAAYLTGQGIPLATQAQVSHQVLVSAAGRQILVFASMPDQGFEAFRQAEGDASIGTVASMQFHPFAQGVPVALPMSLPEGHVVSFVEVGS